MFSQGRLSLQARFELNPRRDDDQADETIPTFVSPDAEHPADEPAEPQASTSSGPSLADRLWSTKVIVLEPDEAMEADEEEEGPVEVAPAGPMKEGEEKIRDTALFITCQAYSDLKTEEILKSLEHTQPRPFGLEWVDDCSVCVLFKSFDAVRTAFFSLTTKLLDTDDPLKSEEVLPAQDVPVFVRLALATDVKQKGAARVSNFYKNQRISSRPKPYERPKRSSRAQEVSSWKSARQELDDELDSMNSGSGRASRVTAQDLDEELESLARAREAEAGMG